MMMMTKVQGPMSKDGLTLGTEFMIGPDAQNKIAMNIRRSDDVDDSKDKNQ